VTCVVVVTGTAGSTSATSSPLAIPASPSETVTPPAAPPNAPPIRLPAIAPSNAFTLSGERTGRDGSLVFTLQAPDAGQFSASASVSAPAAGKGRGRGRGKGGKGKHPAKATTSPARRTLIFGSGSAHAGAAGPVMVTVHPTSVIAALPKPGVPASVSVQITFTPTGGLPRGLTTRTTLKLRKPTTAKQRH
jgi:hypothetical protein